LLDVPLRQQPLNAIYEWENALQIHCLCQGYFPLN
jgi:hypothetical protein